MATDGLIFGPLASKAPQQQQSQQQPILPGVIFGPLSSSSSSTSKSTTTATTTAQTNTLGGTIFGPLASKPTSSPLGDLATSSTSSSSTSTSTASIFGSQFLPQSTPNTGDESLILGPTLSSLTLAATSPTTVTSASTIVPHTPQSSTSLGEIPSGPVFGPLATAPTTSTFTAKPLSSTLLPQSIGVDSDLIYGPLSSTTSTTAPIKPLSTLPPLISHSLGGALDHNTTTNNTSAVTTGIKPLSTSSSSLNNASIASHPLGEGLVFGPLASSKISPLPTPTAPIPSSILSTMPAPLSTSGPFFGPSLTASSHVTGTPAPISTPLGGTQPALTGASMFGPLVTPSATTPLNLPQKLQLPTNTTPSTLSTPTSTVPLSSNPVNTPSTSTASSSTSFNMTSGTIFGPTLSAATPSTSVHHSSPLPVIQQPSPKQLTPEAMPTSGPIFGPLSSKQTSISPRTATSQVPQPTPLGEGLILGPKVSTSSKTPTPETPEINYATRTWCYRVKGAEHGPFPGMIKKKKIKIISSLR